MTQSTPTLLCILDGYGLNPSSEGNAVSQATTPVFDSLWENCPHTTLTTFGPSVGLPEGQMGNSEVGHLNIGAGRIVEQWLVRISRMLNNGEYRELPSYKNLMNSLTKDNTLHLVGLYSDGGVHSHCDHLKQLLGGIPEDFKGHIALHLITDGRDTSPTLGAELIEKLEKELSSKENISIATVSGRFYAMDRDTRWERVEEAYKVIALAEGEPLSETASAYVRKCYQDDTTDEFIPPAVVTPIPFKEGDAFLFWNYRADRMRQIVRALTLKDFDGFARNHPLPDKDRVLCFTEYDSSFSLPFVFEPQSLTNHLGTVIENAGLKQLRLAETEKYPHVTYFFNGGVEQAAEHETRTLVPSPRDVKTYDQKPEMSAHEVTEKVLSALKSDTFDFLVLNFANCDMVGHTGNIEAAKVAVQTVDGCLGQILDEIKRKNGQALIIADHGNAEQMIDYDTGKPHTAHTTYPVPAIVFGRSDISGLKSDGGSLCDVAPTILKMMGIEQPQEMTGKPLF